MDKPTPTIENVNKNKSGELLREIAAFWTAHHLVPPDKDLLERAKQAVYIARNSEGELIAISTVFISMVPNFKNYLFIYRCAIHPDYRIPGLMHEMAAQTCDYLESIYEKTQPYCIGVLAKLESDLLKKNRLIHSKTKMDFMGFAEDGDPLRVYFFKKASF